MFLGAGTPDPALLQIAAQAVIGPVAAFFTFIGPMGDIPSASIVHSDGVSFAGIMAFILPDLVVFPALLIQVSYSGWRMASYRLTVPLVALIAPALILHVGFDALGLLPGPSTARSVTERSFFALDCAFVLNLVLMAVSLALTIWKARRHGQDIAPPQAADERVLFFLAALSFGWIAPGLAAPSIFGVT